MNRRQSLCTIVIFCALIFGFATVTLLKSDSDYSEAENRTLAKMPEVSLKTVLSGDFEEDYETYLTDQFVARDAWIGFKTTVERAMLRTESNDIYFAEDNYLIEKHTGTFTSDTAAQNIGYLQQFVQNYQEQYGDGHLTVMVVPNAVDILRDKLPAFAAPYDEEEYLARIADGLSDGIWFDVSSVLREHSDEDIYYRTDHHWKTLAAFYVYQAWVGRQGYEVPETGDYQVVTVTAAFEGTIQSKLGITTVKDTIELYIPVSETAYTVRKYGIEEATDSLYDYDALTTKSKYDIFFGGNDALVSISTQAGTGRRILVIKDSYAHCFVPFLLGEFDEIDMVDIRYYNQKLSELIAAGEYTDLLFLYNASGFAEDTSIVRLLY